MASVGHVIVGIAASRVEREAAGSPRAGALTAVTWSLLSLLPDADVVGFALGVRYEDPWGHRGATHSFVFAFILAAVIGMVAPVLGRRRLRTGMLTAAVLVSHPLLDTLTDGGLGCALLWPVDLTRYFAAWWPMPVAPIGLAFISPHGLFVSAVEIVLFAPLLLLADAYSRRPVLATTRGWRMCLAFGWMAVVWGLAWRRSICC